MEKQNRNRRVSSFSTRSDDEEDTFVDHNGLEHDDIATSSTSRDASEDDYDRLPHRSAIWNLFQEAASSTSRLYQDRFSGRSNGWSNFQNAAQAISMLYKESLDAQSRSFDAGYRAGAEKAHHALMNWLVQDLRESRCKTVRVQDLVNFMYSSKSSAAFHGRGARIAASSSEPNFYCGPHSTTAELPARELETFRDALHIPSLSGALSRFSVNRSPPRTSPTRARPVDLHAFVTEEIIRHKRTNEEAFDFNEDSLDPDPIAFKRSKFSPSKPGGY